MLKRLLLLTLAFLVAVYLAIVPFQSAANADGQCTTEGARDGGIFGPGITISIECGGSSGAGGGAGGASGPLDCVSNAGVPISCFIDGYPYQSAMDMYCHLVDQSHIYGPLSAKALWWRCRVHPEGSPYPKDWWIPAGPIPTTADELAHEAVATLTLHSPQVNIGAWERSQWPGYGRAWWVGAPVWLWIDTSDPLAWGAHTVSASDPTLSVTATVWSTHVTFTTGDGDSVICAGPGTPRYYDLDSLISEHSPTECDHTYRHTSILGDPTSRYEISATVNWRVDWVATNGEKGAFTLNVPGANTESVHVGELRVVTR